MIEKHPYAPFINENTTKLIIGTTPPQRFTNEELKNTINSDDVDFFYGSRDNYFWEIIGKVFDIEFSYENNEKSKNERKKFLANNKIGMMDIVSEFKRSMSDASDNNLNVLSYQNLVEILKKYPKINEIYFTGGKTESFVSDHLAEHRVFNTIIEKKPMTKKFKVDGREVFSYTLYSPSPAARKTFEDRVLNYKRLK